MTLTQQAYQALADLVVIVHFAFVAFVVLGFVLIWIGWFRRWNCVRNLWFRLGHLAAIGAVAAESVTDTTCPLTTWEYRLRMLAGDQQLHAESFVQHWLHRVMFYDFSTGVFTFCYVVFFLATITNLVLLPPTRARQRTLSTPPP